MSQGDSAEAYQASIKATQAQILEGIQASQQWILEQIRTYSEAAKSHASAGAAVPALPSADVSKMVDDAFDFTQKLLASQREFTHNLVAASTGRAGGSDSTASGS